MDFAWPLWERLEILTLSIFVKLSWSTKIYCLCQVSKAPSRWLVFVCSNLLCKLKRYGLCVTLVGAVRDTDSDALLFSSAGAQRSIGSIKWAKLHQVGQYLFVVISCLSWRDMDFAWPLWVRGSVERFRLWALLLNSAGEQRSIGSVKWAKLYQVGQYLFVVIYCVSWRYMDFVWPLWELDRFGLWCIVVELS